MDANLYPATAFCVLSLVTSYVFDVHIHSYVYDVFRLKLETVCDYW